MPHKVDSYPSSTLSARDSKNVRVHNAQASKGPDLQKASVSSCTQPRKPHLRREEAFRLGRRPMEIDTGDDNDGCASWRREAKRIEALFTSTKAKCGRIQAHHTTNAF
ncbi:hypothetical protein RJ035_006720 [Blastomyces gilchristii]